MKNIELLLKPVSYLCNLNCSYCFYKKTGGIYKNPSVMHRDTLEKIIHSAMEYSDGGRAVFAWQGGEPLLAGIDFYRHAVKLQALHGRAGQVVCNTLQTNGLLIDNNYTSFFREYNVFLGVSLDGPAGIHNRYRRYSSGKGTFNDVMQKVNLLKREGIDFNILSTIGGENTKYPEKIYKFFLNKGFKHLQFIPAVDRKNRIKEFSVTPASYGDFLCRLFDLWWNNGSPEVSIRFFDNILEILLDQEPGACSLQKRCGGYIVIEHNGDVYPCDFFVNPQFKLGNIFENTFEELFRKAKEEFGILKSLPSTECKKCRWNFICNNGCPWFRWINSGQVTSQDNDYLCGAYKAFFDYSYKRMRHLAERILKNNRIF